MIASILRNRLLHFGLIGGALFAVAPPEPRTINVSSRTLSALEAAQAARSATPLDTARAHEVDARAIEDEMLYREALRLSLDKDDPIVRQRLIQKLLLLAEDLGGASRPPTEAELRGYYERNREHWQKPERIHFVSVFAARREALPALAALPPDARTAPALGQAFPYPRDVTATRDELARVYGADFAVAVGQQQGGWSEPLRSSFGWHRVRVVERIAGRPLTFEEARREFALDFQLARREKIVGLYLLKLAQRYDIRVDGKPVVNFIPTRRVAARTAASAED